MRHIMRLNNTQVARNQNPKIPPASLNTLFLCKESLLSALNKRLLHLSALGSLLIWALA